MRTPDLVSTFLRPLNRAGVSYMVTRSVAATIYGEPRFTQDVDIVLSLSTRDAAVLADAFSPSDFYCAPVEVIAEEAARTSGGHFNIYHNESGWRADCYMIGGRDLELWAMSEKRLITVGEDIVPVAPPEYVILSKLEYYAASGSTRHPEDIVRMLQVSGSLIDTSVIIAWADRLGVSKQWRDVESRISRQA
jgi:hypothetical protein